MKSRKKLIAKADKIFSEYIRRRNADHLGSVRCFTCSKIGHWKTMDCGHFMSRKNYSTRWDEKNCQVQCKGCNIFKAGEQYLFSLHLDKKYGEGTSENLLRKSRSLAKLSTPDLEAMINFFSSKVAKLKY